MATGHRQYIKTLTVKLTRPSSKLLNEHINSTMSGPVSKEHVVVWPGWTLSYWQVSGTELLGPKGQSKVVTKSTKTVHSHLRTHLSKSASLGPMLDHIFIRMGPAPPTPPSLFGLPARTCVGTPFPVGNQCILYTIT